MSNLPPDYRSLPTEAQEIEANFDAVTEYEKTIAVPEAKADRQFILCPVGIVGAGKTTVIKPLSEIFSLVRISSDEIRKVFKEKSLPYTQEEIYNIAASLIEKYLNMGHGIAIDSDCITKQSLINDLEKRFGIPAVWIHINPPEEFILQKLRNFNHTWLYPNADRAIEIHNKRKALHENIDIPFTYTFDTSKPDLQDQLQEATEVIKRELI